MTDTLVMLINSVIDLFDYLLLLLWNRDFDVTLTVLFSVRFHKATCIGSTVLPQHVIFVPYLCHSLEGKRCHVAVL